MFILLLCNSFNIILLKQFAVKSEFIKTDALGNIYIVNGTTVSIYNLDGKKSFSYSNSLLGNINSVDVIDPMRILVFYKDFNKIVFLSNKLSEISSAIELDNLGYSQVSACCNSNLGGFWIFDSQQMQLVHINSNLVTDRKGTNIQSFLQSNDFPVNMLEQNDELFVSAPNTGILVFDKFGTYKKTVPIFQIKNFQVIANKLIYFNDNKVFSYSNLKEIDSLSLPQNIKFTSSSMYKNKVILSSQNEVFVYEIENLNK